MVEHEGTRTISPRMSLVTDILNLAIVSGKPIGLAFDDALSGPDAGCPPNVRGRLATGDFTSEASQEYLCGVDRRFGSVPSAALEILGKTVQLHNLYANIELDSRRIEDLRSAGFLGTDGFMKVFDQRARRMSHVGVLEKQLLRAKTSQSGL